MTILFIIKNFTSLKKEAPLTLSIVAHFWSGRLHNSKVLSSHRRKYSMKHSYREFTPAVGYLQSYFPPIRGEVREVYGLIGIEVCG